MTVAGLYRHVLGSAFDALRVRRRDRRAGHRPDRRIQRPPAARAV